MNTAEYIVKRLEELGVSEFFGIPSDYNLNLIQAVENNPDTKWISCTNPLNSGYAADGYARIKGYGAIITSYGAGELGAVNAIAGCMAENIPVFQISGLPSTEIMESKTLIHGNFQDVNYKNFINTYSSVTAAVSLLTKENAKLEVDRLIKIMLKEKKPVYVAIPEDIAQMKISDRIVSYEWISDKNTLKTASKKICEKIKEAKNPVIIGDILIKRFGAQIEFKEFAKKTGIPVSNFITGTNIINMDAPNYIGPYFGKLLNPIAQKYIEESDCLIAVGPIYSDINSFGQNIPFNINSHIAIYGNYTYVEGTKYDNIKMHEVLEAITNLTEYKDFDFSKPNIGIKPQNAENSDLTFSYVFSRIQDYIKENDIIFTEAGASLYEAAQMKLPENTNFQAQALWYSTGWATPAVLGACLAKPQSRVILISGEGSHLQTALEVGNMLKLGIKPIVLIINNNSCATNSFFANNIKNDMNNIVRVNYAKFARVFDGDVWATKVNTAEDFDKALRVTQIMNKLCYIEICIPQDNVSTVTKNLVQILKSKIHNIKVPETNVNNVFSSINEISLTNTNNNCEYETVIHQTFNEELTEKEE